MHDARTLADAARPPAAEVLTSDALVAALHAAPSDVVSPVQELGAGRFVAVLVRGEGGSPSLHAIVASVAGGKVTVEDDLELPTTGLWVQAEGARGIDAPLATVGDFDHDGSRDLAIVVAHGTEPVCAPDSTPSAHVEQLFVVVTDPKARIAASVQTAYAPDAPTLGSRRAKHAWEDRDAGAADLVVLGEECGTRGADGGRACTALREFYRFNATTRSWLKGAPPKRVAGARAPCPR